MDGTLGDEAVTATVLEPRGLTRAKAKRATSYTPPVISSRSVEVPRVGDVPAPATASTVLDAQAGMVRPVPEKGKTHDWKPARWGGDHAEAFTRVAQEFRAGDRLQFAPQQLPRAPAQRRDRDGGGDRCPGIERRRPGA